MDTETEIKRVVRERYASVAMGKTSCCGAKSLDVTTGPDLGLNMIGDAYAGVDGYFADADLGLGCGLPTQHAGIKAGDVVLDLGSGLASTPWWHGASLARRGVSSAST